MQHLISVQAPDSRTTRIKIGIDFPRPANGNIAGQVRVHAEKPLAHRSPRARIEMDDLTSGMYAHSLGGAIGMGYVSKAGLNADAISNASFEIEIARERFSAKASLQAFYDPKAERMKT